MADAIAPLAMALRGAGFRVHPTGDPTRGELSIVLMDASLRAARELDLVVQRVPLRGTWMLFIDRDPSCLLMGLYAVHPQLPWEDDVRRIAAAINDASLQPPLGGECGRDHARLGNEGEIVEVFHCLGRHEDRTFFVRDLRPDGWSRPHPFKIRPEA